MKKEDRDRNRKKLIKKDFKRKGFQFKKIEEIKINKNEKRNIDISRGKGPWY